VRRSQASSARAAHEEQALKQLTISSRLPLVLGIVLACGVPAMAQQQPAAESQSRKEQLEVRKLELEIAALSEKKRELPGWLTTALAFLGGAVGTAATVWAARRARAGALDQAVHEKRIEAYAALVNASAPLALYFPSVESLRPDHCRRIGKAMRAWYFNGGGLLMSTAARDAYFLLARALTRAAAAAQLSVPIFPDDATDISADTVDRYRDELTKLGMPKEFGLPKKLDYKKRKKRDLDAVKTWSFGGPAGEAGTAAVRFKDFVFLQTLSSALRTQLCADLHSRRRPV
jgi:hypothetical protein